MPTEFTSVTTTGKTSVTKLGDVTTVDNDDDLLPTVWKAATPVLADNVDVEAASAWRPRYECIVPAGVVISADVLTGYFPLEITFSAVIGEGSVPLTYLWDFGDGSTSSEEEPTHIYTSEDDFTVTLTVINECGEVVSNELTISITGDISNILFQDNFDGAADTLLADHIPDICPVGSVYEVTAGVIILNGESEAVAELPSADTQARIILSSDINLPSVWMFELLSTPDPTINETSLFTLRSPTNQTMTLRIGDNDSYARFTDVAGVTRAYSITPAVQHRFKAVILGTGFVELYVDDILVGTETVTALTIIDQINLYIAAELTGTSAIDRIHVEALV